MSANDKVSELTNKLIEEFNGVNIESNLMYVCQKHYDLWNEKLLPKLKEQNKPFFKTVVEILQQAGHKNATESLISSYFRRIRKAREKEHILQNVFSGVQEFNSKIVDVQRSVPEPEVITRKVVVKPVNEVPVKAHHTVSAVPVVQVGSNSHVYADTCSVAPEDFDDIREEISRLENEKRDGWSADWCGRDEYFWKEILEAGKKVSLYGGQKWSFDGNPLAIKKELSSEARKTIYDLLTKKVVLKRK